MANEKLTVTVKTEKGDTIRVTLKDERITAFWENFNNLLISKSEENDEKITSF